MDVKLIKRILPTGVVKVLKDFQRNYRQKDELRRHLKEQSLIDEAPECHERALQKLQDKDNIKCVFLVLMPSIWKYANLYDLMKKDPFFDPVLLICPEQICKSEMAVQVEKCYQYFLSQGYSVRKAYDRSFGFMDIIKELQPDLLIYTSPYPNIIDKRYFITNFPDVLTVYVPYNYGNSRDIETFNNCLLHNLVWRYYVETDTHAGYSMIASRNHARNVKVTGYPGIDFLIDSNAHICKWNWKLKDEKIKRIIWAPHHSLERVGLVHYSCFLRYADFMVQIAKKYQDEVQFVFKPHPLLREKLNRLWGKSKTDAYYYNWGNMPNTVFCNDEYIDLFITSDAMIHDSGSFIIEYLYTKKPVMRTMNDDSIENMYNDLAIKAINVHYKAYCESDIEQFVKNVICGNDSLRQERESFVDKYLSVAGATPSENILKDIKDSIKQQILYPSVTNLK